MSAVLPQPGADERRRRSFRLLTFLVAVIASGIALAVTATQWVPLHSLVNQTSDWWWSFLGIPAVALPMLLGVVVALGSLTRGWSPRLFHSAEQHLVTEPIDPGSTLERVGWRLSEVYLVLYPVAVATMPLALVTPARTAEPASFHVVAMYSMVATMLASIELTGLRRWIYLVLLHLVTAASFFAAAADPAIAGLFVLYSLLLSLTMYSASLAMQRLAYAIDETRVHDEKRETEEAVLGARLAEASRIDALIHDHILSALLLTARAPECEKARAEQQDQVRSHARIALATLDEISAPDEAVTVEALAPSALLSLLQSRVHELSPATVVHHAGSRTATVPGTVGHTIVAAACEALRNSLRHSGEFAADGRPVDRRVTLHTTDMGVTTTVVDNGTGFDPSRVPARRLGLRGSIVRRMESLPGGGAEVSSSIGEGTRVSLSWVDPRLTNGAASPARAAGGGRRSAVLAVGESGLLTLDALTVGRGMSFTTAALCLGGACLLGMAALTLPMFHPTWVTAASLGLVAACLASSLLCLLQARMVAWRRLAWVLAAAIPALAGLGLWGYRGTGFAAVEMWQIVAATIMLVLLALAGNMLPAGLGLLALAMMMVVWPNEHVGEATRISTSITAAVFMVAARLIHRWVVKQLQIASFLQAERAARHIRENEHLVALTARRERSAELDDLVRPLLTGIAGGIAITPQVRREAAMMEAELRNSLRAKVFAGTEVVPATRAAFQRGVSVELLDDGGLGKAGKALRALVEEHVTEEINAARSGTVTVRVPPPGREHLVTVLRRGQDGTLARSEIDVDGQVRRAQTPVTQVHR